MHVLSTWNAPSLVNSSLKLGEKYLVLARATRVEVIELTEQGLKHVAALDLWGLVTSLNVLKDDSGKIFATTDHPRPMAFLIAFEPKTSSLSVLRGVSLYMRSGRLSEYFQGAVIDEKSGFAVSLEYASSLKIIPLSAEKKAQANEFDARIPELNVLSMCFLPPSILSSAKTYEPVLAILFLDSRLRTQLITRRIDLKTKEVVDERNILAIPSMIHKDANRLIPIDGIAGISGSHLGGILVLGGGKCLYIPGVDQDSKALSPTKSPLNSPIKGKTPFNRSSSSKRKRNSRIIDDDDDELSGQIVITDLSSYEVSSYDYIDSRRILIADTWGQASLLVLEVAGSVLTNIKCITLGSIPGATTLTYLTNGVLYSGSNRGDSLLARLSPTPITLSNGESSHIEVLDAFPNVGPIGDAVIQEVQGSTQVITCSGINESGSLRIMRKSVQFKEAAIVEDIFNVTSMWPLKLTQDNSQDNYILFSTLYDTTLIDVSSLDELTSDELPALNRSEPTLATCNVFSPASTGTAIVQVTAHSVRMIDLGSGFLVSEWPAQNDGRFRRGEITSAAVNPTQVLVAFQGGLLVYLTVDAELQILQGPSRTFATGATSGEISAMSITPIWSDHPNSSRLAAIGFWGSNAVTILSLPHLIAQENIGFSSAESHLPRSVLLHTFGEDEVPYLLVGLADGSLVAYELAFVKMVVGRKEEVNVHVKSKRMVALGNLPLRLTACRYEKGDQKRVVFVSGSRPAILFLENKRLQHSPLDVNGVSAACMFGSPAYPDSLVLSNGKNITIGQLDKLNELQIRTIPYGDRNPVKISHDPDNRMFGISIVQSEPPRRDGQNLIPSTSFLELIDDATYAPLDQYQLESTDEITCASSLELKCRDETKRYWVIGAEVLGSPDKVGGRITVCTSSHDGGEVGITRVASITTTSSINDVASVDGKVIVASGSGVLVYELTRAESSWKTELVCLTRWDRGYHYRQLIIQNGKIIVLDALRSVEVLVWDSVGLKLDVIARDHRLLWPINASMLNETQILAAEGQGHIFSYEVTEGKLELSGQYYLGEQITKVIPGSVVSGEQHGEVQPSVVFTTSLGRVGVMSSVDQDYGLLLTALERNLNHALPGPGGLEHSARRAPVRVDAFVEGTQTGFVDGDFVEKFLEYHDANAAKKVLEGVTSAQRIDLEFDAIVQRLEQLQMIH